MPPSCNACAAASQRPSRRRVTNGTRAMRGRKATTAAAAMPATATTAKPARVVQWVEPAAATDAIGVRAALSSIPSTIRLRPMRPDPGLRPGVALHDGDADRVVDTARQRDPADAGGAARERERVGGRPLARMEEPLPAPRLEGVGGEEEKGRGGGEHRVGVMDRPAAADEMAHADERDAQQDEAESGVQHELNLPVGEKPQHHGCNGAIGHAGMRLGHSIGVAGVAAR